MSNHTYRVIEIVGTSPDGVDAAIQGGLARAAQTMRAGLVRSTVNSRPPGRRSGRALPGDYESRLPPGGFLLLQARPITEVHH